LGTKKKTENFWGELGLLYFFTDASEFSATLGESFSFFFASSQSQARIQLFEQVLRFRPGKKPS
jgi:hypothetical protein